VKRSGKTRANGNNPALKHIEKWLIPVAAILLTADAFLLFFLLPSTLKLIGIIPLAILAWLVTASYYQKKPLLQNGKAQKTNGMVAVGLLGEILSRLDPDEYKIYDEIQTPYGKIDHVVIKSNGGVFLIEVKPQLGKVTVKNGTLLIDGKKGEKNLVREARRNTYWLKKRFEPKIKTDLWIVPVLVFTEARVEHTFSIRGVHIIPKKHLLGLLQSDPASSPGGKILLDLSKNGTAKGAG
jgi:hypothetical protein